MITDNHIKEVQNRVEKVWLREDGIVQTVVFPGAEYTLVDAKQNLASIVQVSNGKRLPLLVDIRNAKTVNRAARQVFATIECVTSTALLIDSSISQIIGNVFLNFSKPANPTRLFTSETEAVEWLKEFLE
jgi:hypothetical protein